MPSHSAAERAALADALTQAGPHGPTLCDGWSTTELAAHLVTRESKPQIVLAKVIPPLSGWSGRAQDRTARRPYDELVTAFRTGPGRTSPMALPGVDARVNLLEHFVHCEDVRRALPGWEPRDLPPARQNALWAALQVMGRVNLRKSPVSVTLRLPDGRSKQLIVRTDSETVELVGAPSELVLYVYGRKDQARVQLEGPDDAVARFRAVSLSS